MQIIPDGVEFDGLVFDCDGTLADTMPVHYEAWTATLRRHGLDLDEDRFYAMGGWPTEVVCRTLIDESGRAMDARAMTEEKERLFETMLSRTTPIVPVIDVVKQYAGRLPMAVATGGLRHICTQILRHCGIFEMFDAVVTCEDVTRHKPHPDVFLEAARRIGCAPARCVALEDTDPGMASIRSAGMMAIDVRTFYRPRRVTPPTTAGGSPATSSAPTGPT